MRSLIPLLEKLVFLAAGAVVIVFALMSQTYAATEADVAAHEHAVESVINH